MATRRERWICTRGAVAALALAAPLLTTTGAEAARTAVADPTITTKHVARDDARASAAIRREVVRAAKSYLGRPYDLAYGWECRFDRMDCECLNRHAIWDGTEAATGSGLQLYFTLWGQIEGYYTGVEPYTYWDPRYLQRGDLVFWDTGGNGQWGNDLDHTGVYVGNGQVVNAAYGDRVRVDPVYGVYDHSNQPLFVDVLDAHY